MTTSNPNISYVIHIAATPRKLWETLTSSDALKKNWGVIESQWTEGAKVREVSDAGKLLWQGEVLRSEPPHLLSYTFDVIGSGEPPTNVTFELGAPVSKVAPSEPVVRLSLTQSGFAENSKLLPDCVRAWTEILSSIKSYIETGKPLSFDWKH